MTSSSRGYGRYVLLFPKVLLIARSWCYYYLLWWGWGVILDDFPHHYNVEWSRCKVIQEFKYLLSWILYLQEFEIEFKKRACFKWESYMALIKKKQKNWEKVSRCRAPLRTHGFLNILYIVPLTVRQLMDNGSYVGLKKWDPYLHAGLHVDHYIKTVLRYT